MFSLNLTTSNYARSYAYEKRRGRSDLRERRHAAKQSVRVSKTATLFVLPR